MSVKYLITGGTGHLGMAIINQLVTAGKNVRAFVLPDDKGADKLPSQVEIFRGNLLDKGSLGPFFTVAAEEEVIVIHCAGIVSTSSKYFQLLYDVNVNGTKNIVQMCLASKVKKLVHVSSVHAIPTLPQGEIMAEVESFSPDRVKGPYAKTKAEATAYVLEGVKLGLDASIIYPGGIVGPYDYGRGHITQLVMDFYQGRMPMAIHGGFDFVDVRDVAAGVISCCERGVSGEGYILTNRYVSVPEFLGLLHEITGKRKTNIFLPLWIVRGSLPLCSLYYKLRKQPPLFSSYSLYTLTVNSRYSHEKAKRELGYTTRPFINTVKDTVDWLMAEGRL